MCDSVVQVQYQGKFTFVPALAKRAILWSFGQHRWKETQPFSILVLTFLPALCTLLKIVYSNFPKLVCLELHWGGGRVGVRGRNHHSCSLKDLIFSWKELILVMCAALSGLENNVFSIWEMLTFHLPFKLLWKLWVSDSFREF